MAKKRDKSHILTIQPDKTTNGEVSIDIAIEALVEQRMRLRQLLTQIDGDLESLGYKENEPKT